MKNALINFKKELVEKHIKLLQRTSFDKIFIITLNDKIDNKFKFNSKRINIIKCKTKKCIPKVIDDIFENNKSYKIVPYFDGDSNSKYAIKTYNKTYKTNVDSGIFRLKNKMNEFLKEYTNKKSLKLTFTELKSKSFNDLEKEFGTHFILKPINAASSLLNFKITDKESFETAIKKLKSKYNYIIEEYIDGNLYATDFFFDGKNIFITCHTREITFAEILNKFSTKYMDKYEKLLNENFMHFLPVRYTLDTKKIPKAGIDLIKNVSMKLEKINYKGFIHLEYKYNKDNKKAGFIEWGARPGGNRNYFIQHMHHISCEQMIHEILCNKNYNHFNLKNNIYYLANKNHDKNYVGIKTNPLSKTHIMELLKKHPKFMNNSFEDFLKRKFWDIGKIELNKIDFSIKTTSDYYIYPFYQRSDTKFDYIIEFDEENFKKFLIKKYSIIEKFVFHDY